MAVDVQEVLVNLSHSYPQIMHLIWAVTFVIGLMLVAGAVYKLKIYGEMRTMMASQTSLKEPAAAFVVGAIFLYIPTTIELTMNTSFGYKTLMPLSYVADEASGFEAGMQSVLGLIQIVGALAFVRGWLIINSAAQQGKAGATMGKGIIHIVGGILGLNIAGTKEIIWNTFGFS